MFKLVSQSPSLFYAIWAVLVLLAPFVHAANLRGPGDGESWQYKNPAHPPSWLEPDAPIRPGLPTSPPPPPPRQIPPPPLPPIQVGTYPGVGPPPGFVPGFMTSQPLPAWNPTYLGGPSPQMLPGYQNMFMQPAMTMPPPPTFALPQPPPQPIAGDVRMMQIPYGVSTFPYGPASLSATSFPPVRPPPLAEYRPSPPTGTYNYQLSAPPPAFTAYRPPYTG
eukprot:GILK01008703.1.p1 GENE.GILK01008703.1~~GILK01008703.1.p1  ORF type:complete len:221 (+),score=7.27 GILK01008703.1:84-746(+)